MTIRQQNRRMLIVPAALAVIATLFVVVPLISMFAQMDTDSVREVFAQESLGTILGRSVIASLLTTVISLTLAFCLAWCMQRTAMPGKSVLRILVVVPMLIPSVSIGMGVVLLCGNNGILTRLLGLPIGNLYGLKGIVWGSVLYSLPVAFLMIENILKYEDSSPYEAATVLGMSSWQQFRSITLPYLRKPMIVAVFSIFTLSFTDYGVPLMVSGKYKTLPVVMYQEVIGQLEFGKGCVYGSMLLVPALIAFLVDFFNRNHANSSFVTRPFHLMPRPGRDIPAFCYALLVSAFSMMPIVAFVVLAFVEKYPTNMTLTLDNLSRALRMGGGRYLGNSITIAIIASLLGVVLAVLAAFYTARNRGVLSRYLHLICLSMAAIPGVVLGLAYVLFFKGSLLYGTLGILVVVNVVHFFASPYLMMYTAFSKANENLEAVGATLGIGRLRLLWSVFLPQCRRTVAEMFSYFFVNCMMTISAVSFLARVRNKPLALMINQFEAQAQMECAAVVSLMILLINLVVKVCVEYLPEKRKKKNAK